MTTVRSYYNTHRVAFPTAATRVICAAYPSGALALPHQQKIMKDQLSSMGLSPVLQNYTIPDNPNDHGSVVVQSGPDGPVIYFKNDRI